MPGRCVFGGMAPLLLLPLLFAAVAAPVAAQDDARLERARREFDAGQASYAGGDWVGALAHFEASWELTGSPEVLYNIGTVAYRMGRNGRALQAFEGYLRARPEAPERGEVEAKIEELHRLLASEGGDTEGGPGQPADGPDEPGSGPPAPTAADPEPRPAPGIDGADDTTAGGGLLWTWVAGGTAVALGAGAALFWALATGAESDLETRCGGAGCTRAEVDDSGGPTYVTLTNVGIAAAGVALAAAVVLFVLETGDDEGPAAAVSIGPSSLSLRGSF